MSVARVKFTKHAQAPREGKPPLRCGRCGNTIAKGEPYRYWFKGFRSRFKNVRCMTCPAPRTSELESSNKADAYAAVETAEDALAALRGSPGETSDIETILSEAGDSIEEVVDQYREADESFGGGGATVSGEIADELEAAKDELQGFSLTGDSEPEACDEHPDGSDESCDDCSAKRDEWWDEMVDEAVDALSGVSF